MGADFKEHKDPLSLLREVLRIRNRIYKEAEKLQAEGTIQTHNGKTVEHPALNNIVKLQEIMIDIFCRAGASRRSAFLLFYRLVWPGAVKPSVSKGAK